MDSQKYRSKIPPGYGQPIMGCTRNILYFMVFVSKLQYLEANLVWMLKSGNIRVETCSMSSPQNIHLQIKFFYSLLDTLASILFLKSFQMANSRRVWAVLYLYTGTYCISGCLITRCKYQLCIFNTILPRPKVNKMGCAKMSENNH